MRQSSEAVPLRPTVSPRDVGRLPLRAFGRVEIDLVAPDPRQPRKDFDTEDIERLAESIRDKGQLHPIRVRWDDALHKWIIITGERRWRATKAAGLPAIDCYFIEDEISQAEVLEQQLVENLLRDDLKPIEEAKAFVALMELNGWNGKKLAEALRLPASKVSRSLSLLKLPDDIQEQVDVGAIPTYSAYELAKLPNDDARRQLAQEAASGRLTYEQAVKAVQQRKGKPKARTRDVRQTFVLESGCRVVISGGKLRSYFDIEQALQEVLDEIRHRIANNSQLF